MIRPINITLNAAHPELPLVEATTFTGAPSTVFIRGVPKSCGNWSITAVNVAVTYPDNSTTTRAAVESAEGVWVATIPGTQTSGRTVAGFRVLADGIDENGAAVTGYVLGFADFAVFSFLPVPAPGETFYLLRYFDAMPTTPKKGDATVVSGVLKYYNGTAWLPFGIDDYAALSNKPQINNHTLAGGSSQSGADLGLLDLAGGTMTGDIKFGAQNADGYLQLAYDGVNHRLIITDGWNENQAYLQVLNNYDDGQVAFTRDIASKFSTSATYAVNALCVYEGVLYRCTTAITTAEPWTPAHWTEATVQDVFANLPAVARTGSYANLLNRPTINGETVNGNKTSGDYNLIGTDNIGGYLADYAPMTTIADEFSYNTHYAVGDLCIYMAASETTYTLYKCTTAHHGTWNASHFESATVEDVLAALRTGKADIASPAFTGTPTAPTPTAGDSSTKVATTAFVQDSVRYALGTAQSISTASQDTSGTETIDYGAATMLDRTANLVQITTALDELRLTFPAATNGKVRDFELRVEVGTGSAALTAPALVCVAPTGETITLENPDGSMPAIADGTASAKGVTVLYFSETAAGKFLCKGEEVKAIS